MRANQVADVLQDAIATGPSLHVATTLGNLAFKDFVAAKSATIVAKVCGSIVQEVRS